MPRAASALRVELDAHGVLLRAEDLTCATPLDRRDALRDHRLGVLVDRRQRQRRRVSARKRIGWSAGLTLLIATAAPACPAAAGARAAAIADCTSCAARVDVAVERELQRDRASMPWPLDERHRVDARDRRELPLERRRDGRGHRLGVGAGQARLHLDRREVHVRQVARPAAAE